MANYINGAVRERGSSIEKLGKPLGYSQQKLSYRINNDLLTYFEMKYIFKTLNTPDMKIVELMKEKK